MKSVIALLTALGSATALAQSKPTLSPADYAKWETLGNSSLSPDGKWLAYEIRRGDASTELRYHALDSQNEHAVKSGTGAQFSANSRWLLYAITPDTNGRGGRGGARGAGAGRGAGPADGNATASHNKLALVDLASDVATTFDDVQSFSLNEGGTFVAMRRYPATGRRTADVVVRDLAQGASLTFGNVSEMAWSDDGALLAMVVDVNGEAGSGVQLLNTRSSTLSSLDAGDAHYTGLAWRAHSQDLAVYRSRPDSAFIDTSYTVLAFRNAGASPSKTVYDFSADADFQKDMRVASYRRFEWSDDGKLLYFGIAAREPKSAPERRAPGELPPARVQVWHYKDLREFHQQEVNAVQDRQRTLLVGWQVGASHVAVLTHDLTETVQFSEDRGTVLVTDASPYMREVMSGRAVRDVYRVDPMTGKRDKILPKFAFTPSLSPSGRYALYQQGGDWWSLDLTTGARANLTGATKGVFVDMEDDHPVPERRAYGMAGFTTGETGAIVYDRFDLWQVNLDGSKATRLTNGRADSTVYRCVSEGGFGRAGGAGARGPAPCSLEGESRTIDTSKPLVVSATGEYNKKSGYARVSASAPGQVTRALWLDKMVTRLSKAKNADEYAFQEQSYEESPELYTGGPSFADAKLATRVNPFQNDYAWGKQVLMPYANKRGDKLQMMLIYPANYQPGKKYPMVVYYYELLSQGFHQYVTPSDRNPYNATVFSQNGYFVLRPDIVFQKRNPGYSGLDCVTSAVAAVEAKVPDIDAQRVGNMGHSWGGYQSAFYAVHNHGTFAATIAGAPLTDLISMYGYTSGNSGLPETGHYETSQERMDVPLWQDPQAYIRNSTVYSLDSLHTPLLLEEGDADGNVNPFQSQEVYNFGRRLGKDVVYLIYEGENHNVARPESQHDYLERQLQWFGHWLKGEPAATWITDGETYADRQKILRGSGPATNAGPVQAGTAGRGAP